MITDGHDGKVYNLNGPDLLSGPKESEVWSRLLGRPIRYAGHDMDAFEATMRERGPAWAAFDIRMMYQGYLERGFAAGPGDLETLTALLGHTPRTYEAFASETVAEWA